MAELSQLVQLLRQALEEPAKLATFIPEFQRCVWNESVAYPSQAIVLATNS